MTDLLTLEAQMAAAAAAAQNTPPKDADVTYTGTGVGPTWGNVWEWVQARSRKVRDDVEALVGNNGRAITNEIETYTAVMLQAVSGFISDLQADALASIKESYDILMYVKEVDDQVQLIDAQTGRLVGDNYELREAIIPAMFQELADLRQLIRQQALVTEGEMQDWTRDNVTIPLMSEIQYVDDQTQQRELVLAQQGFRYTDQKQAEEVWQRTAAVILLQNQLNVVEKEIQECSQPMCETMGPKTDLGKFLKLLNVAAGTALLAELATLDADGIQALLRGLQHLASGVIDDIGAIFTGGETVGEALGGIVGL